ncbi:acyl-CoA dehydratase activase [Desulfolucanica intricata]|uniref:acyl-CoA dehydratase activase n=1 Tax=Desulfolucanica intricata TaxID=1285191 RepID=UPI0008344EB0|nr:acyl-CoA dehydratase activase [Desulfolucanica intricata]
MLCGIDLGSRSVKVALMDENKNFKFYKFNTIRFYREHGRTEDGQLVVDLNGLGLDLSSSPVTLVTTGYGRQTVNLKGAKNIPEIKAHVLGASFQTGLKDFTLLDLGGQDSKVALVKGGRLVDFQTNDKCAASTGRYLENMAGVLAIDLEELGRHYQNPVDLTSTCAIFGETELIGKVVEGHPTAHLAAGVNYTIFKRIKPMLVRLLSDHLVFTGGVAYNHAIREILKQELKVPVVVPEHPQFMGAVGCCVSELK